MHRRRPEVRRTGISGSRPAIIVQRVQDWGWDAVLPNGTVVQSWPSAWVKEPGDRWRRKNGEKFSDEALGDAAGLGEVAQAWCNRYNAGGALRERAWRRLQAPGYGPGPQQHTGHVPDHPRHRTGTTSRGKEAEHEDAQAGAA